MGGNFILKRCLAMLQRELRVGSVQFVIAPVIVFPNLYSWLDGWSLVCCCVAAIRWNVSKTPIDFLTCSIVNRAFRLSPEKLLATRFFFGNHFIMKRNFLKLSIENLFLKSLQNENTPKEEEENKKTEHTKTTFRARPSTGCSWETTNANVSDFV